MIKEINASEIPEWEHGNVGIKTLSFGDTLTLASMSKRIVVDGKEDLVPGDGYTIKDITMHLLSAGIYFIRNKDNTDFFIKPKADIDKQILDFRASVRTIDWKKILKPTGLKKLKEYIASAPRSVEVFSKLGLKCPINTKAAIFYNDILRFKGLDKNLS